MEKTEFKVDVRTIVVPDDYVVNGMKEDGMDEDSQVLYVIGFEGLATDRKDYIIAVVNYNHKTIKLHYGSKVMRKYRKTAIDYLEKTYNLI